MTNLVLSIILTALNLTTFAAVLIVSRRTNATHYKNRMILEQIAALRDAQQTDLREWYAARNN